MGYTPHVLVLGGGITGTAIARDLAIRGLDVTLVERDGLTSGATGRMQGLLYSGARYADRNQQIARRCLRETQTLAEIGGQYVEETGGLVVGEDEALDALVSACRECEIPVEELSGEAIQEQEPGIDAAVERAVRVPEKVVDPFRLTVATAQSAIEHGATIRTQTEVTDIHTENGSVGRVTVDHDPTPTGRAGDDEPAGKTDDTDNAEDDDSTDPAANSRPDGGRKRSLHPAERKTRDSPSGETESASSADTDEIEPDYVVNATGAWVDRVAELAGFEFPLRRSRSAVIRADEQPVETPVLSYGADRSVSVVPSGTHCVLGVTDESSSSEDPDETDGDARAIDRLLSEAESLVPGVDGVRVLQSVCGVRSGPPKAGAEGRPFVLLDHAEYHDCWGMTSVLGGSLTTHRLVAERVADQVCEKFGISRSCRTAEMALPGTGDTAFLDAVMGQLDLPRRVVERTRDRLGDEALDVLDTGGPNPVLCEDALVTRAEIQHALADESATDLDLTAVRVRTDATMGGCQGGRCGHRIAAQLHPDHEPEPIEDALDDLLTERWRAQRAGLWGEQLKQAAQNYTFHASALSRKYRSDDDIDLTAFDDGPATTDEGPPTARRGMRR